MGHDNDVRSLGSEVDAMLEIKQSSPRGEYADSTLSEALTKKEISPAVFDSLLNTINYSMLTPQQALELFYITNSKDLVALFGDQTRLGRTFRDIRREAIRNKLPLDIYQQEDNESFKILWKLEEEDVSLAVYVLTVPHVIALSDILADSAMTLIDQKGTGTLTKEYLKDVFSRELSENMKNLFLKVKNGDHLEIGLIDERNKGKKRK